MACPPTHYTTLEVPSFANPDEIKTSYKRLALSRHPDRNANDPDATKTFQLLQAAYEILSDETKRQEYDDAQATCRSGPCKSNKSKAARTYDSATKNDEAREIWVRNERRGKWQCVFDTVRSHASRYQQEFSSYTVNQLLAFFSEDLTLLMNEMPEAPTRTRGADARTGCSFAKQSHEEDQIFAMQAQQAQQTSLAPVSPNQIAAAQDRLIKRLRESATSEPFGLRGALLKERQAERDRFFEDLERVATRLKNERLAAEASAREKQRKQQERDGKWSKDRIADAHHEWEKYDERQASKQARADEREEQWHAGWIEDRRLTREGRKLAFLEAKWAKKGFTLEGAKSIQEERARLGLTTHIKGTKRLETEENERNKRNEGKQLNKGMERLEAEAKALQTIAKKNVQKAGVVVKEIGQVKARKESGKSGRKLERKRVKNVNLKDVN
jgi:curved DNA-binding protein CbpA